MVLTVLLVAACAAGPDGPQRVVLTPATNFSQGGPATDTPYPVTDVVMPPHADASWNVIIAFTIDKPGRYYVGRAKIRRQRSRSTAR